jgi:poly(A) polymerase
MLVRDFGSITEVATFRSDGPYSDQRRPDSVEFTTAEHDAERRDFTINAMFLDPLAPDGKQIIDYVGGQSDLEQRVLKAVGDPEKRLIEDHLRALRAIRFAARFGLTIDTLTIDAICAHASDLAGVSVERIGDELRRMMEHPTRPMAAQLLQSYALDGAIFNGHTITPELNALTALDEHSNAPTALAAWAYDRHGDAVLTNSGARELNWRKHLNLSNAESNHFIRVLHIAGLLIREWSLMEIAERKRLASHEHADDALSLAEAIKPADWASPRADIQLLSSDGIGLCPEPLMTGQQLISLGASPGPHFQPVLEAVYDAQLDGRISDLQAAKDLAVNFLKEHA